MKCDFAVVIPMANEEKSFKPFINSLNEVLNELGCGKVYLVIDNASTDNTLLLCEQLSEKDNRFITVWAPENKNVVDAYLKGYSEALRNKHEIIIEMDAGLSHDPKALPAFLKALGEGNECVFGSRFMTGGLIEQSTWKRTFLSRVGTWLANILLGTKMYDMTSGYQGFHASIVEKFLSYNLLSKAHFYQTELRFLLRKFRYCEIPIHYCSPSPRVSKKAIYNSIYVLLHYFILRIRHKSPAIR